MLGIGVRASLISQVWGGKPTGMEPVDFVHQRSKWWVIVNANLAVSEAFTYYGLTKYLNMYFSIMILLKQGILFANVLSAISIYT